LPEDFDFAHYNAAPPALIAPGYLRGNEEVRLGGVLPGPFEHRFFLPDYTMIKSIKMGDGPTILVRMNLDTVLVDVISDDPNHWRVHLSWRSAHALSPEPRLVEVLMLQAKDRKRSRDSASEEATHSGAANPRRLAR
jgi:hypothetical protein